jgi:iron complex transport system ATP-binding protein
MSAAAPAPAYPLRVFGIVIRRVQGMSANFRRITFAGPALDGFGVPGPTLDLRIRLLLPVPGHRVDRPGASDGELHEGWYQEWLRGEQPGRGFIRTYTVRSLRTTPSGREMDVDFVIHVDTGGLASDWALTAAPGDGLCIIGPDANAITGATPRSEAGIRWDPLDARHVLLAGDETAVPAISSILEALPSNVSGHAFLEVPDGDDFRDINTESEVPVTWLARNRSGASRGDLLYEAVRQHVEALNPPYPQETYAWVAAEAGTVKNLRRYLVKRIGLDPKRSEFRGYWSQGKAGSGITGIPVQQVSDHRQFRQTTSTTMAR